MKKLFYLLMMVTIMSLASCTENTRARSFGGESTIQLTPGAALVNVTWKENNLWILVNTRDKNVAPSTYYFIEKSSFGAIEGKIIIKEQ